MQEPGRDCPCRPEDFAVPAVTGRLKRELLIENTRGIFSRVGLFVSVVAGNFYVVFVWANLRLECRDFSSSEGLFISDNTGVIRWLSVDVYGKFARKTLQNLTKLIVCTLRDGAK